MSEPIRLAVTRPDEARRANIVSMLETALAHAEAGDLDGVVVLLMFAGDRGPEVSWEGCNYAEMVGEMERVKWKMLHRHLVEDS